MIESHTIVWEISYKWSNYNLIIYSCAKVKRAIRHMAGILKKKGYEKLVRTTRR